ncbi:hypothetical protein ACEWY4_019369 [Coilia grayii]|uniref:TNFR-Cys domain-containing protein n=1 Tax=Coilia grayii TaxID=363190 RepID=A0ABD1JAU9_9TELE
MTHQRFTNRVDCCFPFLFGVTEGNTLFRIIFVMKPYSDKCKNDLEMYWEAASTACTPCKEKFNMPAPGQGFAANCGFDDDGGQHVSPYENCKSGTTYNSGSFPRCQRCSTCAPILTNCTTTADTQCCLKGEYLINRTCKAGPTAVLPGEDSKSEVIIHPHDSVKWIIPIILVSASLCLSLCYIMRKKWMKRRNIKGYYRETQCDAQTPFTAIRVDDIIAPDLQAAPLQHLLNNVDVLEELFVLLDPDTSALKNTRHLAARCNFSSSWITYAYSRRDHKSPLVAVLEATAARSPDWTLGQLAWLLHDIGRHDAVDVLKKLSTPGRGFCEGHFTNNYVNDQTLMQM